MINITIDDKAVKRMLQTMSKTAMRAAELALDWTAHDIKIRERQEMLKVFDRPTQYTMRSIHITPTQNHNMQASVWFETPDRMKQHYLWPQVEGGQRKMKGFERAFGQKFIPGKAATMTPHGNVLTGQIWQILSVLGKADRTGGIGWTANITKKSARRNKKQRDYVYLPLGSRRGGLPPGIYRRVAAAGKDVDAKVSRRFGLRGAKTYQYGRTKGKFQSFTRARGLEPILLVGRQSAAVKPLFKFYEVAEAVFQKNFRKHFDRKFNELASK